MTNFSEQRQGDGHLEYARQAGRDGSETCTLDSSANQAAFGEAQPFECTSSLAQKIFAVMINLLVLGELTLAMYFAAQKPEALTPVFCKVFFGLLIPTLVGAVFLKRFINARTVK